MINMISIVANEDAIGLEYYMIANRSQKVWLIPGGNASLIKTSFAIYSPVALKGKLLKMIFPYLPKYLKSKAGRILKLKFSDKWIKELFHEDVLRYSVFLGTPSPHQKPVIQIMSNDNKILAYMKFSDNNEVIEIINNEVNMINYLHEKGVRNIPNVLAYGVLDSYRYIIVDTKRSIKSKCDLEWNDQYESYLEQLKLKTLQFKKLKDSEIYKYITHNLPTVEGIVSEAIYENVYCALDEVKKINDKKISQMFYHRDFKPWNCYMVDKELQVYDFEYSMESAPLGLDKIHFRSQVMYLTEKEAPKRIVESIIEDNKMNKYNDMPIKILLSLYILDMITLYITRSKDFDDEAEFYYNMLLAVRQWSENE